MIRELSYNNVIPIIVESMLPKGSLQVLTIKLKINSYYCFDNQDYDILDTEKFAENNPDFNLEEVYQFESIKFIEFIFSRRSNYTLVLAKVSNLYENKNNIFITQSYHDSAWRIDGIQIINKTIKENIENIENMCKKYLSYIPEISTYGRIEDIRLHNIIEKSIEIGKINEYNVKGIINLNSDLSIIANRNI